MASKNQKQKLEILKEMLHVLRHQAKESEFIMSVLSDIQAATAAVQTSVANETSAVLAAIADIQSLPASDAALVPLTAALNAAAVQIQSNADALNKAVGAIVGPPATSPTLDAIAALSAPLAAGPATVSLTGITSTAPSPAISIAATESSGGTVIATPVVSYTTPASTGTLAITPVAAGISTVTVTVSDGVGSVTQSFVVTVA